jgi:hypothetical protein
MVDQGLVWVVLENDWRGRIVSVQAFDNEEAAEDYASHEVDEYPEVIQLELQSECKRTGAWK